MKDNVILEVKNVEKFFYGNKKLFQKDRPVVKAVNDVSFTINEGETFGIVGESGCGKSVTSLSLMQLVQRPSGQTVGGEIRFNTGDHVYNVVNTPTSVMQKLRGNYMSMIFQEPMTSLNPVLRIGEQVDEVIALHNPDMTKDDVKTRTIQMLEMVGIANKEGVYRMYPHELSGGMRQRIMIAMALACNPRLIIADEPTTALDVTIQAQIVELLKELKDKLGMAIIFITHDLGVVSEICDKIIVMYAGKVVEEGMSRQIFYERCHPYTEGLLASVPKLDSDVSEKLKPIKGNPPDMSAVKPGCAFAPRCSCAMKICVREEPPECELDENHKASCWQVIKKAMQNT